MPSMIHHTNIKAKTKAKVVRREVRGGREYLVTHCTMIVPGVLHGSRGPAYYPLDEIKKNPDDWNGIPSIVYHPTFNGKPISARDPDILDRNGIGFIFRAKAKSSLIGESWFDVFNTKAYDERNETDIYDRLDNGEAIEVSTGLRAYFEPAPEGSKDPKGVPYQFIARNYRPDHLAILPDRSGACSVSDGCGINVSNVLSSTDHTYHIVNIESDTLSEHTDEIKAYLTKTHAPLELINNVDTTPILTGNESDPTNNELSHQQVRLELQRQLMGRFKQDEPSPYISDVHKDFIIFYQRDRLFRLDYERSKDDKIILSTDDLVEVRPETDYVPVSTNSQSSNSEQKEPNMATKLSNNDRRKIVTDLVHNCGSCPKMMPWTNKTENELLALSDDTLAAYEDSRKALVSNDQPTEGFVDSLGNRHTFNKGKGIWETIPYSQTNNQDTKTDNNPKNDNQSDNNSSQNNTGGNSVTNNNTPVLPPVKKKSLDDWLNDPSTPEEVKSIITENQRKQREEKEQLLATIIAPYSDQAQREQVFNMFKDEPIDRLRTIADLAKAKINNDDDDDDNHTPALNYAGAGVRPITPRITEEPLVAPVYNWRDERN